MPSEHRIIYRRRLMTLQYRRPRYSQRDSGEQERDCRSILSYSAKHADYLRCNTHKDNAPMRRVVESFGFRECGTITVANGTERIAYDWIKDGSTGAAAN